MKSDTINGFFRLKSRANQFTFGKTLSRNHHFKIKNIINIFKFNIYISKYENYSVQHSKKLVR